MPINCYNRFAPDISAEHIAHSHSENLFYPSDKKKLMRVIDDEIRAVVGCLTFFKAYRDRNEGDFDLQARAAAAVAEDEKYLETLEKNKPGKSSCSLS